MGLFEEDQHVVESEKYRKLRAAADVADSKKHLITLIGTYYKDTFTINPGGQMLIAGLLRKEGILEEAYYYKLHNMIIHGVATDPKHWDWV